MKKPVDKLAKKNQPEPKTKEKIEAVKKVAAEINAPDKKQVYAFIDASNLFWGGKESLGFNINYRKLLEYLKRKHNVSKAFYYSGVRIYDFEYSVLDNKPIDFEKATEYLKELQKNSDEKEAPLVEKAISKISFYQLLEGMGYVMKIKPAKVSYSIDDENQEHPLLKANCDVDMTFDMMRLMPQYSGIVAMTGDGDFASVLSYLKSHEREVTVISRWDRTAKEIRQLAENNFVDFSKLKHVIEYYKR